MLLMMTSLEDGNRTLIISDKHFPEVQISFQFNWIFTPLDFYQLLFFKDNLLRNIFYPTYIFKIAYL